MNLKQLLSKVVLTSISFLIFTSFCLAQEQITITTYYPAPFGIYRELRADQMSIGSGYRSTAVNNGSLIVESRIGIGQPSPTGRLDIRMQNNASYFRINDDNNVSLALKSSGGTPYIDWSNDTGAGFDVRMILIDDDTIEVQGGRIKVPVCIRMDFTISSGVMECPVNTNIPMAPLTPAGTSGVFLCCYIS